MAGFAADVWGLGAHAFLVGYWVAAVVILGPALAYLLRVRLWPPPPPPPVSPQEAGYLSGGPHRAVQVSLAWLRACGTIGAHRGLLYPLATTSPPGATALDRAVWRAVAGKTTAAVLVDDRRVSRELKALAYSLQRAGLAVRPAIRRALLVAAAVLVAIGMVRYLVSLNLGHLDIWLIYSVLGVGAIALAVAFVLTRQSTLAGQYAVRDLARHESAPTDPRADATAVARQVALRGPVALWTVDQWFARHAHLVRPLHPYQHIDLTGGSSSTAGYHDGTPYTGAGDLGGGGGGDGGGGG